MSNPVLVEVTRGGRVESRHEGSVAVFDAAGKSVLSIGDVEAAVFPRSAVKAIQALPLVESGAAEHYRFGDRELAMACASHSGEPEHVAASTDMLARASLDGGALECGVQWPADQKVTVALARSGHTPSALHNNCSGKHSGFLCGCQHLRFNHAGYVDADHPYQELVRRSLAEVTGAEHGERNRGIDGCSIPTYAVPLKSLATGFAKMATGTGFSTDRAAAARRLFAACMAEPFYVAGTDRADVWLMQAAPGRIFAKGGAEGVHCAAIPELGLGIALKCDDGHGRAAEAACAAVLTKLFADDGVVQAKLADLVAPALKNWNGIHVGGLRPAAVLV